MTQSAQRSLRVSNKEKRLLPLLSSKPPCQYHSLPALDALLSSVACVPLLDLICFDCFQRLLPPFATDMAFDTCRFHRTHCRWSAQFYPPHHYWLSQAEPYSLLRVHLPPHTNTPLVSPLERVLPVKTGTDARLPRLLHRLPVRNPTLSTAWVCLSIELRAISDAYSPIPPTQGYG
jgi:hypothetical protein